MSGKDRIAIEDLGVEITKRLQQYSEGVKEDVRAIVDVNAQKALEELRRISPRKNGKYYSKKGKDRARKGQYFKGWKIDKNDTQSLAERKIWNAKQWQLVHLLEHGHVAGGWAGKKGVERVEGKPHVGPVQDKYGAAIERQIEAAIVKRGR